MGCRGTLPEEARSFSFGRAAVGERSGRNRKYRDEYADDSSNGEGIDEGRGRRHHRDDDGVKSSGGREGSDDSLASAEGGTGGVRGGSRGGGGGVGPRRGGGDGGAGTRRAVHERGRSPTRRHRNLQQSGVSFSASGVPEVLQGGGDTIPIASLFEGLV